ncbi:MAG TPA: tetratricopeptide repeat protein [Planctomycetota bacterium]|nr:tetratricopeptide repeat protein [Planctomycetota bacterium]
MRRLFLNFPWLRAAALSVALYGPAVLAGEASAPAAEPAADKISDNEEVVVIGGVPTPGRPVLPASDTEFRLKLSLTGDVVSLRWTDLEESERRRVQKIYGIEMRDQQKVFGDKVTGVRYLLASGKRVEGLPLPERDRPGQKAIKTAQMPLMLIPDYDIKSTENFDAYESDFYSPMEIYQRWLLERPPGPNDGAAHFAMAQRAANIGLYSKAIDHLKMAAAIDPRMEERNRDFYVQLVAEDAKQRVNELYTKMLHAKNGGDFGTAFNILEQLDRNYPNSDFKSRWDALRPAIEAGMKTDITKRIIQMSYTVASDLIQKKLYTKVRIDDKGNLVPSIPGKQVTTRHGHIFRGTLEVDDGSGNTIPGTAAANPPAQPAATTPSGSTSDLTMRVGDTKLTIKAKDIVAVQDIDLSTFSKEVTPQFDDLRDYIIDTARPDGLKMQMIARISQTLREPEARVKAVFDSRLASDATYEDGVYKKSPTYWTLHDAFYGHGSWVREGSKPTPRNPNLVNNSNNNRRQRLTLQARQQLQAQQQAEDEDPNITDDPAVWWKGQTTETQLMVLRAMAAEKVFNAKEVVKQPCNSCRNTGVIQVMGRGGNLEPDRCPICRGIGVLFKIIYR